MAVDDEMPIVLAEDFGQKKTVDTSADARLRPSKAAHWPNERDETKWDSTIQS